MSTTTLSHFFAILSLLTWAGTLTIIGWPWSARSPPIRPRRRTVRRPGRHRPLAGWVVAAVTMAGSLYYSIGPPQFVPVRAVLVPAHLPLPAWRSILLVAALRRDRKVWTYVVPILIVGATIAIYHVQLQAYPEAAHVLPDAHPVHDALRVGVRVRVAAVHVAGRVLLHHHHGPACPGRPTLTATTTPRTNPTTSRSPTATIPVPRLAHLTSPMARRSTRPPTR